MSDTLCVIFAPASPNEQMERRIIKNELKTLQEMVGGYIEVDRIMPGVLAIVNEEGVMLDLPKNRHIKRRCYFGNAIFCGEAGEEFDDLDTDGLSKLCDAGIIDLADLHVTRADNADD